MRTSAAVGNLPSSSSSYSNVICPSSFPRYHGNPKVADKTKLSACGSRTSRLCSFCIGCTPVGLLALLESCGVSSISWSWITSFQHYRQSACPSASPSKVLSFTLLDYYMVNQGTKGSKVSRWAALRRRGLILIAFVRCTVYLITF
jgi:hypothetical protein